MGTWARLTMLLRADARQATNEFRTLKTELALTQQSLNNIMILGSNFIGTMKTIGKYSLMAFGAVSVASAASIAVVKEYDKNLTHAAAIANLTKKEMSELGDIINVMSIQFGQSANDISSGVVELTKAGLGMGDISEYMDDITKAMLANSISFEQASKIAIFAAKQFGGEEGFGAIPELLDVIQKVTQETIMDFGDLQQALAYAGSTAQLAGVNFDELMSMMGALSQRAMEMGIASRSVNQMMMNLIKNTEAMQEWIDTMGLGVEVVKDGKLNLTELIQAFSKLDMNMEQLKKTSEIFTVRAMRGWGLLVTGADEYMTLLNDSIPNAVGTLDQVFERQTETIQFHLGQLGNLITAPFRNQEFISMVIEMLEKLEEPVKRLSQVLYTGMFKFLSYTVDNADKIIDFISGLLEFAFKLVEPFYNIGKMITRMGDGFLKFLIYTKMLMSLGVFKYLQFSFNMMQQQVQLKLKLIGLIGPEISMKNSLLQMEMAKLNTTQIRYSLSQMEAKTEAQKINYARLKLSLERNLLDIEQMKLRMKDKQIVQDKIHNTIINNRRMMMASMAASAITGAFASYAMAEAMGATAGDYVRNFFTGAAMGAMGTGMFTGFNPLAMAAGGLVGGSAAAIGTYIGDVRHEPFEPTVDLSKVESMFNNMDYKSTSYTPTDISQSSSGSSGGTGGFGGGTTVNIYSEGNIYGEQALTESVREALDGY